MSSYFKAGLRRRCEGGEKERRKAKSSWLLEFTLSNIQYEKIYICLPMSPSCITSVFGLINLEYMADTRVCICDSSKFPKNSFSIIAFLICCFDLFVTENIIFTIN